MKTENRTQAARGRSRIEFPAVERAQNAKIKPFAFHFS